MANNVQNIIEISYNGEDHIRSFFEKIENIKRNNDSIDLLYEESEETRDWWERNIGAKWAYIEDFYFDESSATLTIVSAWAEVAPLVRFIDEQTNKETKIHFTYIDEMPNFIGRVTYENGEIVDKYEEMDMWTVIEEEAAIREKAENKNFADGGERNDWLWDWMWDFVYETLDSGSRI